MHQDAGPREGGCAGRREQDTLPPMRVPEARLAPKGRARDAEQGAPGPKHNTPAEKQATAALTAGARRHSRQK